MLRLHDPSLVEMFTDLNNLQSAKSKLPSGKLILTFWEDRAGLIVSVLFCIRVMTFSEFRGEQYELSFLQHFFQSARVLTNAAIVMANPRFTSRSVAEMFASVKNMSDEKWASKFDLAVIGSNGPEGGELWTFQRGAKFSDDDPFAPVKILSSTWFTLLSSICM